MRYSALKQAVLTGAREVLNNPNLSIQSLIEWGTDEAEVRNGRKRGEVVVYIPNARVWLCVFERHDLRPEPVLNND